MRGLPKQIVLVIVAAAALAVPAFAESPSPDNPAGHALGIVPAHGTAGAKTKGGGSNLVYHNGPVMHTNTTYAIYWEPSGFGASAAYDGVISGFFQNVAADDGKSTNVYWSDTQYSDSTNGNVTYGSAFGGSWRDTSALPASGCRDSYTSVCLTDAQIQAEVDKAIAANGWPRGLGSIYFVFTGKGIGSCVTSSECAFSYYCAYHSHYGSGSSTTLYANMPYSNTVPAACGTSAAPNDADADSTLNVTSHEHNETITDPLGNAWYDRQGAENGDKCAWNFGGASGSNQTINGAQYYLQQEWSNQTSRCVLTGL